MFHGSIDFFNAAIIDTPPSPYIFARYFFLPYPIPCSPVHVPPTDIALFVIFSIIAVTLSRYSFVSSFLKGKMQWKLPSPA